MDEPENKVWHLFLVIDDEVSIQNIVEAYLKAEGNTVYLAEDGVQGLMLFRRYKPDLVILDIILPGMDGLEVVQQIRRESVVYVLLLTAKSDEMDRVIGLTVGADDYVTKPFSPRELAARVKAILPRSRSPDDNQTLCFRHLRIDVQHHEVYRDNQPIDLTAREFSLLRLLATYPAWCLAANNCWNRSGATTIMAKTVWARAWRRFSRRQS